MRVYSGNGEIPFTFFTFPDGQPHVRMDVGASHPADNCVTVETAITTPADLIQLLLVKNVLDMQGVIVRLNIRYLMSARMDRRIDNRQPFTLEVVARLINGGGFHEINILDPHSSVALDLLNAKAVTPTAFYERVLGEHTLHETAVVIPDKGASRRVQELLATLRWRGLVTQCLKQRDPQTGHLSKFTIEDPGRVDGKVCLIIDDICDGGGTFVGLSEVLRHAGAKQVNLAVTHGIFSKDRTALWTGGISKIYCTDSYRSHANSKRMGSGEQWFTCIPVEMR